MGTTTLSAAQTAERWLEQIGPALASGDVEAVDRLFRPDGYWRDFLALTWDIRTLHGREAIKSVLADRWEQTGFSEIAISEGLSAPVLREPAPDFRFVEAFFDFETKLASGRGVLRLMQDSDGEWRAWTFLTALQELTGYPRRFGAKRPLGHSANGDDEARVPWHELRKQEREFRDRDPEVVVIGAGQGGLSIAAHLKMIGIDTLIVERNKRVGDNWRNRYDSLVLHDPVWADHLPYMPFPSSWPVYTPKEKLANWLEGYAEALDLNVWTDTELLDSEYDDDTGRWTLHVRPSGEPVRELRPAQVVLATGTLDMPIIPSFPGMDGYRGQIRHSSQYVAGEDHSGERVAVVGAGVSAHDAAQDLTEHGAEVTIVQRSEIYVVSQKHGIPAIFGGLYYEGGPPIEEADLLNAAYPWHLSLELGKGVTAAVAEQDRELLDGLVAAGFKLGYGVEGGGLMSLALRRSGGFYIDVGCSQMIVDGKIKIAGSGIARFTETGVVLEDGTELEASMVIMATGFTGMHDTARRLLGDDVGDRVKPVWNLDEERELRTIWRDSGHPGLWFMGGSLAMARVFGPALSLQIAATLRGVIPHPSARTAHPVA